MRSALGRNPSHALGLLALLHAQPPTHTSTATYSRHAHRPHPTLCATADERADADDGSAAVPPPVPQRIDARGFLVPLPGDVVKVPSKWAGEWDVAQVDFVQEVPSRQAVEVDLILLKCVGDDMWRMPGRKPASIRADIGKLGRLESEYLREFDAFRIDPAQLQPLVPRPATNPEKVAEGNAEYAALKARLLRESAIVGAVGALAGFATVGADAGTAFGAGALAGIAYVFLLSVETDSYGAETPPPRALARAASGRLVLPALLMAALALQNSAATGSGLVPFGSLGKERFAAAALGFLSYKAPLLARQVSRAFEELASDDAQAPIGTGGMQGGGIGFALRLAKDREQRREVAAEKSAAAAAAAAEAAPRQLLICGPSGVGKSTLVAQLLESQGGRFCFSVSTTTRAPRPGEEDGVAYNFVGRDEFERRVERGDFLEWAEVGGNLYGTEMVAVERASSDGRVCVLDVDVQGVLNIIERPSMRALCVWIAPPSFDAIRTRLQRRGTDDPDEIERRVARAREEIEFSVRSSAFDHIIVNDNLEDASRELQKVVAAAFMATG